MSFMKANHYINLEKQYGANNYAPLDVVITKGEGVWVEDVDGNRYLDCLSAYSAVNQGHCHPRIVKTLIEQAQKLQLTSRAFRNDQLGPFYEQICQLTGYEMALPMNTGAEAVETALKAARKWGYTVKGVPDGKEEIIEGASPLFVDDPGAIRGKRVLVVEDGPTLTHGEMAYGAGWVAARRFGAAEIVDPRPFAVGSIIEVYNKYPTTGNVLPAMGYSEKQIKELEKTIQNADVDLVVIGTPIDLSRILKIDKPSQRVQYELQEIGKPTLEEVLREKFKSK